jgi:hypothetical protein
MLRRRRSKLEREREKEKIPLLGFTTTSVHNGHGARDDSLLHQSLSTRRIQHSIFEAAAYSIEIFSSIIFSSTTLCLHIALKENNQPSP